MATYPYDPRNYLTDKLDPGARQLVELTYALRNRWPSWWCGSGWRTGSSEHITGRAADNMFSSRVGAEPTAEQKEDGDAYADWLYVNRKAFGLRGLIWHGRLRGYSDPLWLWRRLLWKPSDAGNQHRDHVHWFGLTSVGVPAGFLNQADDATAPSLPVKVEAKWDGKSFPGVDAFKVGQRHDAVTLLDKRLIAHGYTKYNDGDGYQAGPIFTEYTRLNVKAFQGAQGWTGTDADGFPGPETWKRLMAAPEPDAAPAPAASTAKPARIVRTVSVKHVKAARYEDPDKRGRPLGRYANEVYTVEEALRRTKWLRAAFVDGHYGSQTVGDGSSGFGGVRGFQVKHSGVTLAKADGWLGKREMKKLFKLAKMSVTVTS